MVFYPNYKILSLQNLRMSIKQHRGVRKTSRAHPQPNLRSQQIRHTARPATRVYKTWIDRDGCWKEFDMHGLGQLRR